MKYSEMKALLKELTQSYFTGATVTYAKQSFIPKPDKPLVTLTCGSTTRPMNPPTKVIDGRPVSFYPATVPIQIDLFTNGQQKEIAPGYTPILENTAEDDMLAFANFLNSAYAIQWCDRHDITILVPPTVQDLTGLIHDTNYEFRAMLEVTVNFTMEAIGYTATLDIESIQHSGTTPEGLPETGGDIQADDVIGILPVIKPTPSGGGNEELGVHEDDYFTNVEINKKIVKEETSHDESR